MLKALMLRRSIDAKKAELAELTDQDKQFQTREAELETAINEVEPGNAEQEAAVNAEIAGIVDCMCENGTGFTYWPGEARASDFSYYTALVLHLAAQSGFSKTM